MSERRTHVIRLTAVGDPDTYIDMERIDLFSTDQSQPDHWQKIFTRLDWGDGATREVYGPDDLLTTETSTTPDTIVEGPGPLGEANRDVTVIDVANPQDPSQIVKVGVVKKMSALEYGESPSYQKTFSLFDDTQPDGGTTRSSKSLRVVNSDDASNYIDAELIETFIALEHGKPTYQKTFAKLDNRYLLDAFDLSPGGVQSVRFDPFQFPINVNWKSNYLIITLVVKQYRTSGAVTLSNFNIPGWEDVSINMTDAGEGQIFPSGNGAPIANDFLVSTKPSGAQGWASPFNVSSVIPSQDFGQSYVAINLGAAKPNATLQFDVHIAASAPPQIPAAVYIPQEILADDAIALWGEPIGNPAWPRYHYGPVTDIETGERVFFYSDNPGGGGLYGGPALDPPTIITKDEGEGLWGLPAGNPNWPPLVSLTPAVNTIPGPLFGQLVYQYLPGIGGTAFGVFGAAVFFTTAKGMSRVVNPDTGLGLAIYAPPILPEDTPPGVTRASVLRDVIGLQDDDLQYCLVADPSDTQSPNWFPHWYHFPYFNIGDINRLFTDYNGSGDEDTQPFFGSGANGGIPPEPPTDANATATFSVNLITFAITKVS